MNRSELERLIQPAIGYLQLDMIEEADERIGALIASADPTDGVA